jgi:hypothetical protein
MMESRHEPQTGNFDSVRFMAGKCQCPALSCVDHSGKHFTAQAGPCAILQNAPAWSTHWLQYESLSFARLEWIRRALSDSHPPACRSPERLN